MISQDSASAVSGGYGSGDTSFDTSGMRTGSTATGDATSSVHEMADQAKQTAGNVVDQAKQQATSRVSEQKDRATQGLNGVANAMTMMSDQLRDQNPSIAQFAETAAQRVQQFSSTIETRDLTELVDEVERFARQ